MSTLRLTLRTLLAYLDDTLDPSEIKSIGEKVADSTTAQETIARVKKLVRKRRLTTPPFTGPGAKFDANTIAEYLDNALDHDAVTDLEQFCLEKEPTADLYLAEIASCHQILTLVLGEPLMVPTTAKQRMVALVQGREAIPYRKPATGTNTPKLARAHADMDLDEGSRLLGLSPRKSPWLVWAVPAIAAILLVGAGLALYFALPQLTDEPSKPQHPGNVALVNPDKGTKDKDGELGKDKDAPPLKDRDGAASKDKNKDSTSIKDKDAHPMKDKDGPRVKDKDKDGPAGKDKDGPHVKDSVKDPMHKDPMPEPIKHPVVIERPGEVNPAKAEVATYTFNRDNPTVLLQKQEGDWKRLPIGGRVASAEPVVALPGYACSVKTDKGVNLLLRGSLPQFSLPGIEVTKRLLDCSITLHQNSKVDADLTFHRGRLYISNGAQPATVIVRFWKEAWVIHLTEPNSEVGLDLVTRYTPQINYLDGEEPKAELYFLLLKGKADLYVDTFEFSNLVAAPGTSYYYWDNKGQRTPGPVNFPKQFLAPWSKEPPPGKAALEMTAALKELALAMVPAMPPKAINVVVKEGLGNPSLPYRVLCIYTLSAIDRIDDLLDQLGDEDPTRVKERDEATYALRLWMSRDAKHNLNLYNAKKKTGILIDKGFMQTEALTLVTLLNGLSSPSEAATDDPRSKLRYLISNLSSPRVAIRHVADFLLARMTASIPNKPMFNAAAGMEAREGAVKELGKMLDSGALTPGPGAGRPGIPPKP